MNKLEQFIRNHKDLFEDEPITGHYERLQQKMNQKSLPTVVLHWSISIAASIAIVFSAGIVWQHAGKQDEKMLICENSKDMKACYLDKMNATAIHIEALTKHLDIWDRQQVMTDVQIIIDTAGSGFEKELPEELPKNKAKAILSDYYRHNLESLEMIVEELRNKS